MMYPTGTGIILGTDNPPRRDRNDPRNSKRDRTRFRGYEAGGFDSNSHGGAGANGMHQTRSLETGSDWAFLSDFVHDTYMPVAGTALLVPSVGLPIRREERPNPQQTALRHREGRRSIPRFLPRGAGSVAGFCSGEEAHEMIVYLIEHATKKDRIDLFAYTFDHPLIADALVRAAIRGTYVCLTVNRAEVEGESSTSRACATLFLMMQQCNNAGCGPSAEDGRRTLDIRKQQGQLIAPVYAAWGRPIYRSNDRFGTKGAMHAKLFVIGPKHCVPPQEDRRVVVMGSTNMTVASECNLELSLTLEFGSEGAATVDQVVRDLRLGAYQVTYHDMENYARQRGVSLSDNFNGRGMGSLSGPRNRIVTDYGNARPQG